MDRQETCQRGGWKKEGVCSWQASFCVMESCISYDIKMLRAGAHLREDVICLPEKMNK